MKYLKLFEAFTGEVKFYRFNRFDLLGDVEELKLTPKQREMKGQENVNNVLIKNGFPDKQQCVHFMDELAFNTDVSSRKFFNIVYGKFIYEIEIDDKSLLGWSFITPINDWFYKHVPYSSSVKNNPDIQDLLNSEYKDLNYTREDNNEDLDKMAQYLLKYEVIGRGTLDDLKNSKFFGKQKLFVWTTDDVIVKKFIEKENEIKEPEVLSTEDFLKRGVKPEEISQFYQSEMGKKLKRLQPTARFQLRREEAIRLLDEWIKTL